jgi:hypothetical protein
MLAVLRTSQDRPVEAAFAVAAARQGTWTRGRLNCTELYPAKSGLPTRWSTRRVFEAARKSWHHELAHGSGRPLHVPSAILVEHVVAAPISSRPGYELRAIQLRPADDDGWLICYKGWPVGVTPFRCDRPTCPACDV